MISQTLVRNYSVLQRAVKNVYILMYTFNQSEGKLATSSLKTRSKFRFCDALCHSHDIHGGQRTCSFYLESTALPQERGV